MKIAAVVRRFAFLLTIFVSAAASAQTLYGANGAGGNPATVLATINPATGVATPIGPIGFAVTGLAMHPITGVLYGSTAAASPVAPNSLITINTTTGAGTLVGGTGLGGPVADITFRADGTLFGWSEASDELVVIDTTTGAGTVVGPSGTGTFGSGIAFSAGGTLFFTGHGAAGDLGTVNPATGLYTAGPAMVGSAFSNAMNALAFDNAGILYGVDFAGGGAAGAANLVTIDTATGVITTIGASLAGLDAIAFAVVPAAVATPVPAPTLSEWAMILLVLSIAASGVWMGRRHLS